MRQVGHHKLIHEQSQTDHIALRTPHEEMSSGLRKWSEGADMWYLLGVYIQPKCSSTKQTYIETMQPRPFEEWIEKGHQRDVKLCGAYARPTDERSLVRGGGEYNQGSFVYLAKACGG